MDECRSTRECELCRRDLDKQNDTTERRLNAHSEGIQDLTRISDQLAQLMTTMIETQNKMDARLLEIEKIQIEAQAEKTVAKVYNATKWYETKSGEWIIRTSMIILLILVCAAIGRDAAPSLLKLIGKS